jgi:hypothetical protein
VKFGLEGAKRVILCVIARIFARNPHESVFAVVDATAFDLMSMQSRRISLYLPYVRCDRLIFYFKALYAFKSPFILVIQRTKEPLKFASTPLLQLLSLLRELISISLEILQDDLL